MMQTLREKHRAAALKRREREGRHHDSYSLEAIKLRREMRRNNELPEHIQLVVYRDQAEAVCQLA